MTVTWDWDVEAYISAAWVSLKRDIEIFKSPVVAERGIDGSDITNRVASPGSLSLSLDNGESNSAGLLGYYSPEHANFRANFGRNTLIRLSFSYLGTDYYKFYGFITDLEPTIGQFKERSSILSATDYMQRLAAAKINLLSVQQDQRSDQIAQTIITAMETAPLNTDLEQDDYTLPFALASEQDERTSPMGVLQKICQTTLRYVFMRGNTTDGETLVMQSEKDRASNSSAATLNDTMSSMSIRRSIDNVKNRIIGKVHPVRVDEEATTLIYENDNDLKVGGGDTETFTFRFKDPQNLATRISAIDVVDPPVADTHYRASKYENTTKNDANGNLSIVTTIGGNSAAWEIENTGGSFLFINLVNIFGRGIYYFNPFDVIAETGDADRETTYDFFYMSDHLRAKQYLVRLLERTSSEEPDIESVKFFADENATLMGYAMTLDIGDRVTVQETATGVGGEYTINRVSYTIETDGTLGCEWGLEPADSNDYFILDSSLLDGADVLSPY